MTAQQAWVVRLRSRTGQWTTPGMPAPDAQGLFQQLRAEIDHIGGGQAFVAFTAREDRELAVRAKEVTAIELAPEDEDRPGRRATGSPVPAPAPAAQDWLRGQGGAR